MGGRPLKVGLTGGIGSGKTTVGDCFAKLGAPVIDADVLTRGLQAKGRPAYREIVERFGDAVLDENGELDRKSLRGIVFDDKEKKAFLEAVIHPRVREAIARAVAEVAAPYCILSIPLLFESGLQHTVDRILVVDVDESVQLERACARDKAAREQIRKIMETQTRRPLRLAGADDIIDNNGGPDALRPQALALDRKYRELGPCR